MNWRFIRGKQISCIGCGAPQRDLGDNRHFSWCQLQTDLEDGPRKVIRVAESVPTASGRNR